jgi:hypothetical protein
VYCGNCNQRTITHRPHFQQPASGLLGDLAQSWVIL